MILNDFTRYWRACASALYDNLKFRLAMDVLRGIRSCSSPLLHKEKIWRKHLPEFCGLFCALLLFAALPLRTLAQDDSEQPRGQEIVANLCSGRVVIGVAKDGIVVATLENPIEPETRPPMIVQVSEGRVAILLGAADWWLPDENRELASIYAELPNLPSTQGRQSPRLQQSASEGAGSEATGIEQIANRLRERLSFVANYIHGSLDLDDGEPLLQMVLVDYAPDYGPEVWLVKYSVDQEPEQGDYWQTRVLQPHYTQLWPPEKGQPRGLIEVSYPSEPTLANLISGGDAGVAQAISATPGMQQVSEAILDGKIEKESAADVAEFLRTCLHAATVAKARMVEAELNPKRGVGWFVRPPAEIRTAGSEQVRPPGAPSLRGPAGKPPGPGDR